jgi:hypothetical protein
MLLLLLLLRWLFLQRLLLPSLTLLLLVRMMPTCI